MVALCETRLAEITEADIKALTQFAEVRLVANGAPPSYGEDVTQRAFEVVLRGLNTDRGGRRPRPVDISDKLSFLNYMRGVIASGVYRLIRGRGLQIEPDPSDCDSASADLAAQSPAELAELKDLEAELFPRLRARAPHGLMPTIEAWQSVFLESDRIPRLPRRSYIREVRELTKEVLIEIGGIR